MLLFEDVEARPAIDDLDRRAEAARKATGYPVIDSVHYLLAMMDEYADKKQDASSAARVWARFTTDRTKMMTVIVRLPRLSTESDQPYTTDALAMKWRAINIARSIIPVVEPIDVLQALMTSPDRNTRQLLKFLHIDRRDVLAAINE